MARHRGPLPLLDLVLLLVALQAALTLSDALALEWVSVAADGGQGDAASVGPSLAFEGRDVVFDSLASNIIAGDLNDVEDVFLHDRWTARTELISQSSAGVPGTGWSKGCAPDGVSRLVSSDGRYVAFYSAAPNLVPRDENGRMDVFVRDRTSSVTELISMAYGGPAAGNSDSSEPSISDDGRYVAFASYAGDLVLGDVNDGIRDVFVRDRAVGTTKITVGLGGAAANGSSKHPFISGDGGYVVFDSAASDLVPGDTNGVDDVFVYISSSRRIERVSVSTGGNESNGASGFASISPDGRYVVFESYGSNLAPSDTNGLRDIFLRDRTAGTTERISLGSGGEQADGASATATLSLSARYVAFLSAAANLSAVDTNDANDVYVRDRERGETHLVSVTASGSAANSGSGLPFISADGRYIAFHSFANNLVAGDSGWYADVFVAANPANRALDSDHDGISDEADGCPYDGGKSAPEKKQVAKIDAHAHKKLLWSNISKKFLLPASILFLAAGLFLTVFYVLQLLQVIPQSEAMTLGMKISSIVALDTATAGKLAVAAERIARAETLTAHAAAAEARMSAE